MATAIKHKQRSKRVWRALESTRKSIFNDGDVRSVLRIKAKLLKKEEN